MASVYAHKDTNIRKTWLLMSLFLIVIIAAGWGFSLVYGAPEILWVAAGFAIVMNLVAYWKSDALVLKISGAHRVSRESHRELWNVVENLSITAGLPVPALYIINDPAPNAFATGRNPDHAAVAVTTGLLHVLDRTELEGVIAHELSHIGNRDILISTVVVVLVGFLTLLSDFFLRMSLFGGGRRSEGNAGALLAIVGVVLIILSPIIGMLIQLAISRKREFLADASAALLTRYPRGLADALEKIHTHSHTLKRANHATAHLYITNPFGHKKARGLLGRAFSTHPPVGERVRALRDML